MSLAQLETWYKNQDYQKIIAFFENNNWQSEDLAYDFFVYYGNTLFKLKKYDDLTDLVKWMRKKFHDGPAQFQINLFQAYLEAYSGNVVGSIQILEKFTDCPDTKLKFTAFLYLGRAKAISGELRSAISIYQALLAEENENIENTQIAGAYSHLGTAYGQIGELQKALEVYHTSLTIGNYKKTDSMFLSTSTNIGVILLEMGENEYALAQFKDVLENAEKVKNYKVMTITSLNVSEVLLKQGDLVKAKKYLLVALEMAVKSKIKSYHALSLSYLGEIEITLGNYEIANQYLTTAIQIVDKLGRLSIKSNVLRNLSLLKIKQGKGQEAIEILTQLIEIKQAKHLVHEIGEDFLLLIEILLNRHEIEEAAKQLVKMVEMKQTHEVFELDQLCLLAQSEVELEKNNFGTSLEILNSFLLAAKDKKLISHQIQAYLLMTKIFLTTALWSHDTQAEIDQALKFITMAKTISENANNPAEHIEILDTLSSIKIIRGKFTESKKILQEALEIATTTQMIHYQKWIHNKLENVTSRKILKTNKNVSFLLQKQGLQNALESISSALFYEDPTIVDQNFRFDNFIVYKISSFGPAIHYMYRSLENTEVLSSGVFLMTALSKPKEIGAYNTGFYGPLPFLDKEALVFTNTVKDAKSPDPRLKGKNYVMFVFVIPKNVQKYDRISIKTVVKQKFKKIHSMQELSNENLSKLMKSFALIS